MLARTKHISILPKPSENLIPISTIVQPVADLDKINYPDPNEPLPSTGSNEYPDIPDIPRG